MSQKLSQNPSTAKQKNDAAAICRHFGECGGCQLQHLTEEAYSEYKRQKLADTLRRTGFDTVNATLIPIPHHTRRRVTWKVESKALGYFANESHRLVSIEECPLLVPPLAALIAPLQRFLATLPSPHGIKEITAIFTDTGIDLLLSGSGDPSPAMIERMGGFAAEQLLSRISWRMGNHITPLAVRSNPAITHARRDS